MMHTQVEEAAAVPATAPEAAAAAVRLLLLLPRPCAAAAAVLPIMRSSLISTVLAVSVGRCYQKAERPAKTSEAAAEEVISKRGTAGGVS